MNISKIGNVEFSATTSEEVKFENEVTNRAVEDIGYISDHVKPKPVVFSVSGVIVGQDAFSKLKTLRKYCQGKQVYKYIGRNIMSNVVIESFTTTHNKEVQNGFEFTMSCKIIKQAKSKKVKLQGTDPVKKEISPVRKNSKPPAPIKKQTSSVNNAGKYVNRTKKVDAQKAKKYDEIQIKQLSQKKIRHMKYSEAIMLSGYLASQKKK
ncbi:hypothetical protein HMPREF1143_0489 [Peptoanaerobacter stomatis]|uniref:Dit-like phage tail protein N-terminal domain-containing protein n=1 Tax=Peptoanaerobacter stomatis TaxID=796937 RepID=J5UJ96_9FIRM|nr:hypothetical protein [Peptoanaerobacter stomatis]EJU22969.1 hypothetical protein HMPREF1143_0489 [Peptoanaerobacter stomatis]